MGLRGPAPEPTAVLRLRGSRRADSRKDEPQPPKERPRKPAWMPDRAKRVWDRLVPILDEMGLLSTADAAAIERYCVSLVRWRECEDLIAREGMTYTIVTEKGGEYTQQRPEVGIASKLATTLLQLEREFGLTPSARARLVSPGGDKGQDKDAVEKYFA